MPISGIQGSSTNLASLVSKATNATAYDPKDTNQDGVVSAAEELAYALKHPELAVQTESTSPLERYTQAGTVSAAGTTTGGSLNLLV